MNATPRARSWPLVALLLATLVGGGIALRTFVARHPPGLGRTNVTSAASDRAPAVPRFPDPAAIDADAPIAPPPSRSTDELPFVRGVVVDPERRPIANAWILTRRGGEDGPKLELEPLRQEELETQVVVRCEAAGRFELRDLPPRTISLAAVAPGRVPAEWRDIAADRAANQDVVLVLEDGRALAGRVVDSDGRPIAQARVEWTGPAWRRRFELAGHLPGEPLVEMTPASEHFSTTTDSDGRFHFDGLPLDHGEWNVTAAGYAEGSFDEAERPEVGRANGTSDARTFTLTLRRAAALFHVVAAESGAPLDDARVVILESRDGGAPKPVAALPFALADHDEIPARWRVRSRLSLPQRFTGSPRQLTAWIVAPGRRSASIDFALDPTEEPPDHVVELAAGADDPCLSGRITGADQARVELRIAAGSVCPIDMARRSALLATATNPEREFTLNGLPPMPVVLDAIAEGCAPIRLELELPVRRLLLEFAAESRLAGTVRGGDGRPVAGRAVALQLADYQRAWHAVTNVDGRFEFFGLSSGRYGVGALPDAEPWQEGGTLGTAPTEAWIAFRPEEQIELASGGRREIDLLDPHCAALRIHVVDEHGAALPDVDVQIVRRVEEGWSLRVPKGTTLGDPRGATGPGGEACVLEVVPGRVAVHAGIGAIRARAFAEVRPIDGATITLTLPVRAPRVRLAGRVVELGTERPIAGARIDAFHGDAPGDSGLHLGSTVTDEQGRFELAELAPGPVLLLAQGPRTKRADRPGWLDSQLHLVLHHDPETAPVVEPLVVPLARQRPPAESTITVKLRLLDADSGSPLHPAIAKFTTRSGNVVVTLGATETDAQGRIELSLPRVEHLFVEALAPHTEFELLANHLPPTELALAAGANGRHVDTTLRIQRSADGK